MKKFFIFAFFTFVSMAGFTQSKDSLESEKKIAPWWVERFKVSAGFFLPVNSTTLQVGIKGETEGTKFDFEKDLGASSNVGTFLASASWRISRKSRLNFSYYNIDRSSTHKLEKSITFKDKTYDVNATVKGFFNTAIYQFSYGYAILSKPKYEAGVMIGAHMVGGKVGLDLVGANAGVSTASNFGFTAPLPDLGLWGGYAFSDRFAVNLEADYLSLTVGDITGSIFAYNIAFTYRLVKKLDLSLGYSGLNFKVDAEKKGVTGQFKWSYNGPALAFSYSFGNKSWGHPK